MGHYLRRVRRGAASIAVAGAAVVVLPAAAGAPGASCAAAGEIHVRVVVDFGDRAGAPAAVSDVCVPVADRTSGAELLAARARRLGTPAPRFDGGFLCAIDGVPETGCGNQPGDGNPYWSYWHGDSGKWVYANVGAATWKLRDGDVEGWRLISNASETSATPPRADAAPCPVVAAPSTTAATLTTSPSTTVAPLAAGPTSAPSTSPSTSVVPPADVTTTSTTAPGRVQTAASRRADDGDGGAPVGLLVVGAGVLALAVAAGLRFRRREDA